MPGKLQGRIALVTGGANGIGRAIAQRLAAEGAEVCITDIELETAERVASNMPGAWAARVDVADWESVVRLARTVQQRGGSLNMLVNNAAIADASPLETLTMDHYQLRGHGPPWNHTRCFRSRLGAIIRGECHVGA